MKLIFIQTKNITVLCDSIRQAATPHASIAQAANEMADTFAQAFELFGRCHRGYNSSTCLTDGEIDTIGK